MAHAPPSPIPAGARCRGCGYSLEQLETFRCPECGRRFDPRDLRTFFIPAKPKDEALAIIATGRSTRLFAALLCLLLSAAFGILVAPCAALPIGVLGAVLLIRFVVVDPQQTPARRGWRRSHDGIVAVLCLQIAILSVAFVLWMVKAEIDAAVDLSNRDMPAMMIIACSTTVIAGIGSLFFFARSLSFVHRAD